jgi:diguanylate cyclase (GGDEF)-like protein/hemerythrin-like metal-binding protein
MQIEPSRRELLDAAKQAMDRIRELKLPFEPRVFELWSVYYSGGHPALRSELDAAIASSGAPTYEVLINLHERHIAKATLRDQATDIRDGLQDQAGKLMATISAASGARGAFQIQLVDSLASFLAADDAYSLGSAIARLAKSTMEVQNTNVLLNARLTESDRQVRQLQDRLRQVQHETLSDPLTGAFNRRKFETALDDEIKRSVKDGSALSLLLIDIDRFKQFNDEHGHLVGDDVLRLVSGVIKQSCRTGDTVSRLGGDEFAIILPDTSVEGAVVVAEKVRQCVMERELLKRSTKQTIGRMTISVGAAQYQDGDSADTIVARADQWLYAAKRNGRNCVGGPYRPGSLASIIVDRSHRGLRWSASYECGNPVIDREHCQLFVLTNTILDCDVTSEAQLLAFSTRLDVLMSHIASHFRDEEAELAARRYDSLSQHKAIHSKLLNNADQLRSEVQSGRRTVGDLREFIINVVVFQHILTSDREFFPLFKTRSATRSQDWPEEPAWSDNVPNTGRGRDSLPIS